MIDSYKQGNKTLPAAEEEGSHTNGGLARPQRLFAGLRRTAIFASHFQARVRFFGLGDISPDATPGARPKNSGAGPNVAANHAPAGINPAVSGSAAIAEENGTQLISAIQEKSCVLFSATWKIRRLPFHRHSTPEVDGRQFTSFSSSVMKTLFESWA